MASIHAGFLGLIGSSHKRTPLCSLCVRAATRAQTGRTPQLRFRTAASRRRPALRTDGFVPPTHPTAGSRPRRGAARCQGQRGRRRRPSLRRGRPYPPGRAAARFPAPPGGRSCRTRTCRRSRRSRALSRRPEAARCSGRRRPRPPRPPSPLA